MSLEANARKVERGSRALRGREMNYRRDGLEKVAVTILGYRLGEGTRRVSLEEGGGGGQGAERFEYFAQHSVISSSSHTCVGRGGNDAVTSLETVLRSGLEWK